MAKNKAKFNKFLTGAVTATMVAAAVVPVAAAADFSDVTNAEDKAAVAKAVELGFFQGGADGKFNPYKNITRGQVAKTLARYVAQQDGESSIEAYALKHDLINKVTPFDDIPLTHSDQELVIASGIVKHAGVFTGSNNKLDPSKDISRAQMASVLVRAFGLEDLPGDLSKVTDADTVDASHKANIHILSENGVTTEALFRPSEPVKRVQMAKFLNRSYDVVNPGAEEVVAPEVESVTAINATEVEVKFSQPVDKADATTNAPYKVEIQGVIFTGTPELSEDGKTLTLTTTNPIKVTDATVSVEPIKTKADANVQTAKYVGKITYEDTVAPTIVSVEAQTNGTVAKEIEIKVSEPLKASTGLVKVNGAYVTPTIDGTDTIKVTGLSLEAGKTHTVELINIEDKAGNKTVSTKADFTVAVDKAAPTVTVTAGDSDKEILVTFNKKMDVATVIAALANGSVKDEALAAVTTGTVTEVTDSKGTQFKIPVNDTLYTNKDSRTLHVVLTDGIKDSLGNKLTAATQSVTLTKDTAKPVATGYKIVKETDGKIKAIEVNFSEGISATTGGFSVVDSNGVLDTTTFAGFTKKAITAGDKKVVFEIATAIEITGQYAFSFDKELVTDSSESLNKSDAFNYTIDFGQADGEFKIADANKPVALGNVITVTFPEAVKGGAVANSATDPANYSLAGKPLPAGTTITLQPGQLVAEITLPATNSVEKDDPAAVFTVANIKNTAGTKSLKTYTGTVAVLDNVAPVLQSAKVLDNQTIELTYSENVQLDGSLNVGDSFKIVQGSDELVLTNGELTATVASGFENKLVIKVNKPGIGGTPASATKGGTNDSIVTLSNQTSATATANDTFTIQSNGDVENAAGTVLVTLTGASGAYAGSFTYNGVTVTIAGGTDGDEFTVNTTAAVAGTADTTLDLTKDITIETLTATPKVVVDKSAAKNQHKKEVKVNVVKP